MPYIKEDRRKKLHCLTTDVFNIESAGELNYVVTELIKSYIEKHSLDYKTINDIVGALECAKQEFYRRIVIPYEDKKIEENGDVYFKLYPF